MSCIADCNGALYKRKNLKIIFLNLVTTHRNSKTHIERGLQHMLLTLAGDCIWREGIYFFVGKQVHDPLKWKRSKPHPLLLLDGSYRMGLGHGTCVRPHRLGGSRGGAYG